MKLIVTALFFTALALPAGDPQGLYLWKSTELKAFSKSLHPKMDAKKVATQSLAVHGNYSFLAVHREGSGDAEFHETVADVFVVESGEATLVYGGKLVDGKTTAPNEIRAPSIAGGMEKKLAPGDAVTIPAKTPHQVKLEPGQEFTYFVVKIKQ